LAEPLIVKASESNPRLCADRPLNQTRRRQPC
jgi:hypothetical protein